MLWSFILFFSFYILITALSFFFENKNKEYTWYIKHIKGETYYPNDFINDIFYNCVYFDMYRNPTFIFIKLLVFILLPFVKIIQFALGFIFFIYNIFNIPYCVYFRYGEYSMINHVSKIDPRNRFIDLLYILFILSPFCKTFVMAYNIYERVVCGKKPINYKDLLYNILINRILGLSLWNVFIVDIISLNIYNSLYDDEFLLKKNLTVLFQIINEKIIGLFVITINTSIKKSNKMRIYLDDGKLFFNPLVYQNRRNMRNLGGVLKNNNNTKNAFNRASNSESRKSVTSVLSPNNRIHPAVIDAKFDECISGGILTHFPLDGQEFVSFNPDPLNKDTRTQRITTNTFWNYRNSTEISNSLLIKTGLYDDDKVVGVQNMLNVFKSTESFEKIHYQDKNKIIIMGKNEFKEAKISGSFNKNNTGLHKLYSELPDSDKSMIQEHMSSIKTTILPHDFHKKLIGGDPIENLLKLTGKKNISTNFHTPFKETKDHKTKNIHDNTDDDF